MYKEKKYDEVLSIAIDLAHARENGFLTKIENFNPQ